MRIVIDLQGAQTDSRFRGIGRYSKAFALAMARNAGAHEIWIILNAAFPNSIVELRHAFAGLVPNQRIRVFKVPAQVAEIDPANAWRVRAAEKIREHFIASLQPDVVVTCSLFEGLPDDAVSSVGMFAATENTAVILYDLIPLQNPTLYLPSAAHLLHYERKIASLKQAGLLLAISDFSRQDAIASLYLDQDRVISISAAIDARFAPRDYSGAEVAALCARFGITRKMVMYAPGGFDSRKNFEGLIAAYALLPLDLRSEYQLVIVSKINDDNRVNLMRLREMAGIGEDEFVLTDYVTDDELVALYNLATLFVFPSKYEGFGLPVLEAMACGAPTIGANATSVPEVIGWDDALFDPASPDSIAAKMVQVLRDDALRAQLRQHGLDQAEKFTWDASALRAIAGFESRPQFQQRASGAALATTHALLESIIRSDCDIEPSDNDLADVASAIAFNTSGNTEKQLLVDISVIVKQDAKSGIQRVVRSVLLELLTNAPPGLAVRPVYFDGEQYRYASIFVADFLGEPAHEGVDELAEFHHGDIYLGLDLNAHLAHTLHPLHMFHRQIGVEVYFIVYDILLIHRPDWWLDGVAGTFETWLHSITQAATGLVCISEAVAGEVRQWIAHNPTLRHDPCVISSFHLGAEVEHSLPSMGLPDDTAAVLAKLQASPSFLMVGTLEPRKGHAQTLAAFEILWEQGIDVSLVIVGKNGWLVDALIHQLRHHPESGKHLFWLEGISDEYLGKIYAASTCLIAASQAEGFGLPLIESARHQRPIIARDIAIFREVAGSHAFYFSGLDAQALANAVHAWLALDAQGLAPQSTAMPWLTWRQSVNQLLENILPQEPSV